MKFSNIDLQKTDGLFSFNKISELNQIIISFNDFSFWILIFLLLIFIFLLIYVIINYKNKYSKIDFLLKENKIDPLSNEKSLLRTLLDNIPDLVYIKDSKSRFIIANKGCARIMKSTPEKLVGKTDFDFYPENLANKYFNDEQNIIKSGDALISMEEPIIDADKNKMIISSTKVPLKDKDGKVIGIVGMGRDISKLKNFENQLLNRSEELEKTNKLLLARQEEIQQAKEELETQAETLRLINIELEKLNKTKDKFFSIIAHDLKNPFHAIMGFSELLSSDFYEIDDQQKLGLIELINVSSESAFNLLENLLQWARTQTDRIKFKPEIIDLTDVVNSTIKLHKVSAEKKRISLTANFPLPLKAIADKNMITTVVRNLISNAIKFVNVGGEIKILGSENDGFINLHVIDNGIGIHKNELDELFRIDTYHSTIGTSGESGTGLGLIICKEFVEKNQGTISVESKRDKGSKFTIRLPSAKQQ